MKLTTDHIFHIGYQHLRNGLPCQDFALSGTYKDGAYAIVSDGCSTGGMTDVGARIIALMRQQSLLEGSSVLQSGYIDFPFGLKMEDLLATSVVACFDNTGKGWLIIHGDGCLAVQYADGRLDMWKVDWANNMPCYPVYATDQFAAFIAAQGNDIDVLALTWERRSYASDGSELSVATGAWSLIEGTGGFEIGIDSDHAGRPLKAVAVFTDGVQQVEGKEWHEVIRELLAFKTTAGGFTKRRMQRFLSDVDKLGRGPQDDIAYAVIRFEQEQTDDPN